MICIILLCLALAAFGAACELIYPALPPQSQNFGIALPSPNLWNLIPVWGEVLNVTLIGLSALTIYLVNKQFSLIRTDQPLGAAFFLPLMIANLAVSSRLSAAPLISLLCLFILASLFNSYRKRNATRSLFFIASCLSLGSLFEYAMIPFIIASLFGAFFMDALRFKEFLALGLGLISPYWVLIGLGIVNPLNLNIPLPVTIFSATPDPYTFTLLALITILTLAGVFLTLYNGFIIYAGNTRVHRCALTINTFGLTAAAAMWFDISNILAYFGVFYIWISFQLANLFTLRELPRNVLTFWFIQLVILASALPFLLQAL